MARTTMAHGVRMEEKTKFSSVLPPPLLLLLPPCMRCELRFRQLHGVLDLMIRSTHEPGTWLAMACAALALGSAARRTLGT